MRSVKTAEGETWRALAREHGFGGDEGRFTLGRFIVETRDGDGALVLCAVTPIPATLRAGAVPSPGAPLMFDRTPADEIIVPGSWWRVMFEQVSEDRGAPAEMRRLAGTMAATTACDDVVLPADSDTVEISAPDDRGKSVRCEALPPGTRVRARVRASSAPDHPGRASPVEAMQQREQVGLERGLPRRIEGEKRLVDRAVGGPEQLDPVRSRPVTERELPGHDPDVRSLGAEQLAQPSVRSPAGGGT